MGGLALGGGFCGHSNFRRVVLIGEESFGLGEFAAFFRFIRNFSGLRSFQAPRQGQR